MKTLKTYNYEILYFETDPLAHINIGFTNTINTLIHSDLERAKENSPEDLKQHKRNRMAADEKTQTRCLNRST